MSAPILVTSAAGFIGRQVVDGLLARSCAVRAFDLRLPIPVPGVAVFKGSVEDPAALRAAINGTAAIVHLAYHIDIDGLEPQATVHTNIAGTAMRDFGWAPRFDLRSSVADYLSFLASKSADFLPPKLVEL